MDVSVAKLQMSGVNFNFVYETSNMLFPSNFRVFAALPNLQSLDGIAKLPEDEEWHDDEDDKGSGCVIA